MAIYNSMLFLIIILGLIETLILENKLISKICYSLLFFIFVFFYAFRSPLVGYDTMNYVYGFNYIGSLSLPYIIENENLFEKGYMVYTNILSRISSSYGILFLINALITYLGVFYFIKSESRMPFFSLYLFFTLNYYGLSLNISRQFMALSIFLLAYTFLEEKKFFVYLVLVILASTFHEGVIIMILLPLLYLFKPNIKNILIILSGVSTVAVIIYLFPSIIMNFSSRYESYFNIQSSGSIGLTVLIWIFYLVFCFAGTYLLKSKHQSISEKTKRKIFNSGILIIISIMFSFLSIKVPILHRMEFYFSVFIIILIPEIIYHLIKEKKLGAVIIGVLVLGVYLYYLLNNSNAMLPYQFIWEYK